MANVHDAAAYILAKSGCITAMKLEKLTYYSQAWSLVWDEAPLFDEPIQAWVNGPVCPALYAAHKGMFDVSAWPKGNADALTKEQRDTVDSVLHFYGEKTSQWLSDLTHSERPWIDARCGLAPGERGQNEISHDSMSEYYGSLPKN
ncbi:MAG TPA: type II toxin-antitoxin system antitoxin SocA domain-containing protein [Bryobacteraceae bacterium]|jgi:uncharacterized phage-associated protein|nr:type II toxin-antitoxin system antitoxin SocA domain-containing protein [Bryobacteraceae bacterium]